MIGQKDFCERCFDIFLRLKEMDSIFQGLMSIFLEAHTGFQANYLQRTSLDCKSLQSALRIKYGFEELTG